MRLVSEHTNEDGSRRDQLWHLPTGDYLMRTLLRNGTKWRIADEHRIGPSYELARLMQIRMPVVNSYEQDRRKREEAEKHGH